jgi:saccharopepsin
MDDYAEIVYGTDRFFGELAVDTFRIAGIEVSNQAFINVARANPLGFLSFYNGYEGTLGLAPRFDQIPHTNDLTQAPSPWFNMLNGSLLDRNLFALELPAGPMDWNYEATPRTGEITFGDISKKYKDADFTKLALSEFSDQVWAVEAHSLTWENETHPIHEEFVNVTLAGFDTTGWFLGLPGTWARQIYASVEHQCDFIFCQVDCLQRAKMPNFTFGLAGHNLTITPYQYTKEVMVGGDLICLWDMMSTRNQFPVDAIVLGTPFMEAFYR